MVITRSRSVPSSSVSHRASSRSRSPPQRRRITPQLQLFDEEEARLAAEGHRVTKQDKVVLGRLLSKGYKRQRQRQRKACVATGSDLRVHIKMNKGKSHSSTTTKSLTNDGGKAGELFAAESLEEYAAEFTRDNDGDSENEDLKKENEQLKMKYNKESSAQKQLYDEVIESLKGIL